MKRITVSSPAISKAMEREYGDESKEVKIRMRHGGEVSAYLMKIEEAHKKASESKLIVQ
jgi:hypothetical protein